MQPNKTFSLTEAEVLLLSGPVQASHVPEGRKTLVCLICCLCFHVCDTPVNFHLQVTLSFQTEVPSTSL